MPIFYREPLIQEEKVLRVEFKKLNCVVGLVLASFILASCKQVAIPNGEVPKEYLDLAKTYIATYQGGFGTNSGALKISLDGSKLQASFKGDVNDVTGDASCGSVIGDLLSIQVNDQGTELEAASFAFSPNKCSQIQGKSLDLIFLPDGPVMQLSASILKETKSVEVCTKRPPPSTAQDCHPDYQNYYFSGIFEKASP